MTRIAPLLIALGVLGCGGGGGPAPVRPHAATWEASNLVAGEQTGLAVTLTAGAPVAAGTELRIGFPHWVYGARVERPPAAEKHGWGHWYLVSALPAMKAGDVHQVAYERIRVPRTPGPGYHPLVWVGWDPVAGVADGTIAPAPDSPPPPPAAPPAPVPDGDRVVVWADLHGHSGLSDGRGTPAAWFAAARAQGLDVAALSDHDWQLTDAEWATYLDAVEAADEPGAFVAIPAAEVNRAGHEVAYFFDAARLRETARGASGGAMTIWEETDLGRPGPQVPDLLADYGRDDALLVASHSTLAPNMGTGFPLEAPLPSHALFEVYSAHGSSECEDCPRRAEGEALAPGQRVGSLHDALDAGHRFALLAAGDGHDGSPGAVRWGAHPGGLAGLEVDALTREAVHEALAAGRVWGTTGERTTLLVRWDAAGGAGRAWVDTPPEAGPVEAIEVVADRAVVHRIEAPEGGAWHDLPAPSPGTRWRYVRVILPDGARAWGGTWYPPPP